MTFKEILERGVTKVIVTSYGYDVKGVFGHFEPFGNKARKFEFTVVPDCGGFLEHDWLYFENEEEEWYEIDENGVCICFDPELFARDNF